MVGDEHALTPQQKREWAIFNGQGRCMSCHGWNPTRPLFTDDRFNNIGVSAHKSDFVPLARKALTMLAEGGSSRQIDQLAIQTDLSGLGRFLVTKQPHDIGAFRTMDLRNLLSPSPTSTTARKPRFGTHSTITTRAAFRIRFSMAESSRLD
jgi:cytochrome c peroxidase